MATIPDQASTWPTDNEVLQYLLRGDNFKRIYHQLKMITFQHNSPDATTTYTGLPLSKDNGGSENAEAWLRDIWRFDKQSLAFLIEVLPYFYEYAATHVTLGKSYELLDIGPRTGSASNFLGQLFADEQWGFKLKLIIDTLDLNPSWNEHIKIQPFIREHSNINLFDVPENSYDFCFCSHTLEHVDDPIAFVGHMKKVAREFSFITCPFNEVQPIPGHHTVTKEIIDQCEPLFFITYKSVNRWQPDLECVVFIVGK